MSYMQANGNHAKVFYYGFVVHRTHETRSPGFPVIALYQQNAGRSRRFLKSARYAACTRRRHAVSLCLSVRLPPYAPRPPEQQQHLHRGDHRSLCTIYAGQAAAQMAQHGVIFVGTADMLKRAEGGAVHAPSACWLAHHDAASFQSRLAQQRKGRRRVNIYEAAARVVRGGSRRV